jgi:hypothetical protein
MLAPAFVPVVRSLGHDLRAVDSRCLRAAGFVVTGEGCALGWLTLVSRPM